MVFWHTCAPGAQDDEASYDGCALDQSFPHLLCSSLIALTLGTSKFVTNHTMLVERVQPAQKLKTLGFDFVKIAPGCDRYCLLVPRERCGRVFVGDEVVKTLVGSPLRSYSPVLREAGPIVTARRMQTPNRRSWHTGSASRCLQNAPQYISGDQ